MVVMTNKELIQELETYQSECNMRYHLEDEIIEKIIERLKELEYAREHFYPLGYKIWKENHDKD